MDGSHNITFLLIVWPFLQYNLISCFYDYISFVELIWFQVAVLRVSEEDTLVQLPEQRAIGYLEEGKVLKRKTVLIHQFDG